MSICRGGRRSLGVSAKARKEGERKGIEGGRRDRGGRRRRERDELRMGRSYTKPFTVGF